MHLVLFVLQSKLSRGTGKRGPTQRHRKIWSLRGGEGGRDSGKRAWGIEVWKPIAGPGFIPLGKSHRKALGLFCKLQVPILCQAGLFSCPSLLLREQTIARRLKLDHRDMSHSSHPVRGMWRCSPGQNSFWDCPTGQALGPA